MKTSIKPWLDKRNQAFTAGARSAEHVDPWRPALGRQPELGAALGSGSHVSDGYRNKA